MNGKPNVEPPWMSLKRLIETRMVEILCKEQGNRKYPLIRRRRILARLRRVGLSVKPDIHGM